MEMGRNWNGLQV
jgi:transposase InsO family protein